MVMAEQGGNSLMMRDYRKGNWTLTETMILIEAKKMDDERRTKRTLIGGAGDTATSKPTEPRWKWVEDYCWKKSCFRSQNQCNDKWDNLMRDYKKVRDYERRRSGDEILSSYWKMEKNERKDNNLPTNMVPQIFDALTDVVEKKGAPRILQPAAPAEVSAAAGAAVPAPSLNVEPVVLTAASLVTLPQYVSAATVPPPLPPPPPPPPPPPVAEPQLLVSHPSWPPAVEARGSSGSETNENYSDSSPAKRRRRSAAAAAATATATAAASGSASSYEAVGAAISRSASMIADTLQACDQREERRHRDLLSVQERRLKVEESKAEISRQGVAGLVDAINKLADSIHALAASSSSSSSSKPNQP